MYRLFNLTFTFTFDFRILSIFSLKCPQRNWAADDCRYLFCVTTQIPRLRGGLLKQRLVDI